MAQPNERSIPEVFSDIAHHIQEIIRSELLLAKVEMKQEGQKAIQPVVRLCVGAIVGMFAVGFFLLMCMFLLWQVLPWWLGALIIWVVLAPISLSLLSSARIGLRRIHPTPERTVRTVKENVQWAKEQMH
ncbi:MAG: phage holin family protein [Candidatus Acidiferrales bacterium]